MQKRINEFHHGEVFFRKGESFDNLKSDFTKSNLSIKINDEVK